MQRLPVDPVRALAAALGAVVVGTLGKVFLGWPGLLLGLAAGGAGGWFGVKWPRRWMEDSIARQLKELNSKQLFGELKEENWPVYHLYFAELRSRREDLKAGLACVVELMEAEDPEQRRRGLGLLRDFFPSLASKSAGYDPDAGQDACRAGAEPLRREIPPPPPTSDSAS